MTDSAVEPFIETGESQLSAQQTAAIVSYLKWTWKLGACRTCGSLAYELLAMIVLRFVDKPNILMGNGPERPGAALVCSQCGEYRLLDLTIAGVIARPTPRGETGPSSGPFR